MSVFDEMRPASFRGARFNFIENEVTAGRKLVEFNFPNKDFREFEDLGRRLRTIRMRGIIHGTNYTQDKLALENALDQSGFGILVHPTLGEIIVTALPHTVTESLTQIGVAGFSMTFEESGPSITPRAETDNRTEIANQYSSAYAFGADDFDVAYQVSTNRNLVDSADHLLDFADRLIDLEDKLSDTVEARIKFASAASSFISNVYFIAGDVGDAGNEIANLLFLFDDTTVDPVQRFEFSSAVIGFGLDDELLEFQTDELDERRQNAKLINGLVNGLAFINICDAAKDIDYLTEDDLNLTANIMDGFYDTIVDSELVILTPDFLQRMDTIRNSIRVLFDQIRLVVLKVIEVQIPKQPLTIAVYSQYGSTDEYENIVQLNSITNPAVVEGNLKLLET